MNNLKFICSNILFILLATYSGNAQVKPTVQDLDFLVGTWELTMEIYDTQAPEKGILFTEKGTQECFYDLSQNDRPMFITCKGELTSSRGRKRSFQESIRFGQFVNSYERVGIFSNWPATSKEFLKYDSTMRQFIIKGELDVQDNMLERYEDIYQFNKDYTYYERVNFANFSNMPVKDFNLTLKGTGKKIVK